jgi:hypothetical protein
MIPLMRQRCRQQVILDSLGLQERSGFQEGRNHFGHPAQGAEGA